MAKPDLPHRFNARSATRERIPVEIVRDLDAPPRDEMLFELAGPRAKLFFDPARTRAGIVICGGLCPGLNNVIRALFLELHHTYGVAEVLGFRGGYQGLDPVRGAEPVVLTPAFVDTIHKHGGAILGTSRGPVDMAAAVGESHPTRREYPVHDRRRRYRARR